MKLTIGVPKELKTLEKRVGLTPRGVGELCQAGLTVWVQKGAGQSSGFSDDDYKQSGAQLAETAEELYRHSQIVQKVKEPLPEEFGYFRPGLILFSFLHLAAPSSCDLVRALREKGVTAIAFETIEKDGHRPLLTPMSEIAGALSALYAGYFINKLAQLSGPAELVHLSRTLEGDMAKIGHTYPKITEEAVACAKMVVFGGGAAGVAAARYGLHMGGSVIIVEKNEQRCEELKMLFSGSEAGFHAQTLAHLRLESLVATDVLIGAVHHTGKRAMQVINKEWIEQACETKKKVIMDISIDQGGNFPEALPTSYEDPLYLDTWGNVRFGVPNIPSMAGRYASEVLTRASWPYVRAMAENYEQALTIFPEIQSGINIERESVLNQGIKDAHGLL